MISTYISSRDEVKYGLVGKKKASYHEELWNTISELLDYKIDISTRSYIELDTSQS